MSKDKYYDFKLELKVDQKQVFVRCPQEGIDFGNPVDYIVPRFNVTGKNSIGHLKEKGSDIADMLLPKPIRDQFVKKWDYGKRKIRLRLCYPIEGFENTKDADNQIDKLMRVPWEYIYLCEEKGDPCIGNRFLALRDEVSIVHSLRPVETGIRQRRTYVERPKVKMKYFSWLGPNNEDDAQRIYQKFVAEFPHLRALLDCCDINDAIPTLTDPKHVTAEFPHILVALQQDDFIHITCHGDPDSISLIDRDLKLKELVLATDAMRKIKARAIILLSCGSGGSTMRARSIARALNQGGVPVVIGMARTIPFEVAGRFVGGFYHALAAWPSEGLEKAVVHGRLGILKLVDNTSNANQDIFGLEKNWHAGFGIPRLFLSSPDSVLIPENLLFGSDAMRKDFDGHISKLLSGIEIQPLNDDLDKISNWVEQPEKPWYFVAGREGSEKSRLIAQLIDRVKRDKKHEIIYHFCRQNEPSLPGEDPADPLAFIRHSLAPQLKESFENYRTWKGRFPLLVGNKSQAVRDFVLDPLKTIVISGTEPPLIVIDDVHFFRPGHGFQNSILKLLSDHWDELVNVARFVIAADVANPIIQQRLKALLGEPDLRLLSE
jgi:hypothetical protein